VPALETSSPVNGFPTERARARAASSGHGDLRELTHGPRLQDRRAFREHELRKARQPARGRKQSRVSRDATQPGGVGIVDDTRDGMAAPDARGHGVPFEPPGRAEHHLTLEPEGRKHFAPDELVEWQAADAPHDLAQQNRVEIGVHHP
jgi:hypothetical protein